MFYDDVVPQHVIQDCIDHYYKASDYRDPSRMNKLNAGIHVDTITKIVERLIGTKAKFVGGNFYRHDLPYLPHTDWKSHLGNNLNVVVPLEVDCDASLIVFDQKWGYDSVTWCMHLPVLRFEVNTGVKGCPHEYPIEGRTGKEIDHDFWQRYLSMYQKDMLYDLSGKALTFKPRSLIIFDNRKIHGTSNFKGTKLGLSLRYKV
jgi:hypothetical protein